MRKNTDLIDVIGNSKLLKDTLSIGVYLDPNKRAILIDSGIDDSKIKKINKSLPEGYKISAIINTHSHADHCGGNAFAQKQNSLLQIFATSYERAFVEIPDLEPCGFSALSEPPTELAQNKHLHAQASHVTHVIPYEDHELDVLGNSFKIITLPGHTPGMIGVISPDQVLYCGDALFGTETFEKHGVLFYTNIGDTLKSLRKLKTIMESDSIKGFVFYHGGLEAPEKIPNIIDQHIEKITSTANWINELLLKQSLTLDELTAAVIRQFNIPQNVVQHALTQTCVRAFISYLQRNDQIKLEVSSDGTLRFISNKQISQETDQIVDTVKFKM